ncbi:MAG: DUF1232 domain-containing protein [Victivallales bacterium]|nr:DUF1232 domain-containing protein [Victivallales bacterium]
MTDEEKNMVDEKISGKLNNALQTPPSEEKINELTAKESKVKALFKKLGEHIDDVKLLWDMLLDYKNGLYKDVPWKLIAGVFFFTYLLLPLDVIPDFIPVVGFADDIGVLGLVLAGFTSDIAAYKKWRDEHKSPTQIG